MRKSILGVVVAAMACGVAGLASASDGGEFPFPKMVSKNCANQAGAAVSCFDRWRTGKIVKWTSRDGNLTSVTTREKPTDVQAAEGVDYVLVTRDDEGNVTSVGQVKEAHYQQQFQCWGGPDAGCGVKTVRVDR
jgi:hypothetical protein